MPPHPTGAKAPSVRPPSVFAFGTGGDRTWKATVDQMLDRHRLEDLAEAGTRGDPHMLQDHRGVVVAHGLWTQPVDTHQWSVDGANHVGHADLLGVPREPPPARLPTLAHHQAGATQVGEDRLQEPVRDVLQPAQLLGRHGHRVDSGCDLDEGAQGVVGLGGNPHAVILSERPLQLPFEAGGYPHATIDRSVATYCPRTHVTVAQIWQVLVDSATRSPGSSSSGH